ncbi:hypothetical protein [Spirillospora sp. NPDC047279]|uniref:hypothetical protein n=1 Tax=Spirillospora sp. NPDC047279 TaxID=3155478 RepID=UPI0033F4D393
MPGWSFVAVLVLYFAVPVIVVLVDFASLGENAYQALGLEFRLSPMNAALVTAIVFEVVAAVWLVACYAGVSRPGRRVQRLDTAARPDRRHLL